jgi:hypothetical protein
MTANPRSVFASAPLRIRLLRDPWPILFRVHHFVPHHDQPQRLRRIFFCIYDTLKNLLDGIALAEQLQKLQVTIFDS